MLIVAQRERKREREREREREKEQVLNFSFPGSSFPANRSPPLMSELAAVNFSPFRDHLATRHPGLLFLFNASPGSREKQETVARCPTVSGIRFAKRRRVSEIRNRTLLTMIVYYFFGKNSWGEIFI